MGDSDAAHTARAAKVHMTLFAVTRKNPAPTSSKKLGKVVLRPQLCLTGYPASLPHGVSLLCLSQYLRQHHTSGP